MSQVSIASNTPENNAPPSGGTIGSSDSQARTSLLSPRIFHDLYALLEFSIIAGSAILAKILYIDLILGGEESVVKYLGPALAGSVIAIYLFMKRRLYEQQTLINFGRSLTTIVSGLGLAMLLLIAIGFATKSGHVYSRGWLFAWMGLALIMLVISRLIVRWSYKRALEAGYFCKRIAILGSGELANKLKHHIETQTIGTRLVGVFDDPHLTDAEANVQIDGSSNSLIKLGQQNGIDEVIVASSGPADTHLVGAIEKLRILPVSVMLCPYEVTQKLTIRNVQQFGSLTLLNVQRRPINEWGYLAKSAFDFLTALFGLILLSPILLCIALAVKLTSKGPIFFSQKRHGYNHKVINVHKFRTMTVMDAGDGEVKQATADDKRVTTVGRFLRRTSLDELPQLINVLKGDMSLVGPRPHALTHNHYYSEMLEHYANRHRVKPGITGLAQIYGYRGPTENIEKMRGRVDYDLEYIDNWSFWLDVKILLSTFRAVMAGENAF